MSVGLLLITHENIASSLLNTARKMLNTCPLATRSLEVPFDYSVDEVLSYAKTFISKLDTGNGVLIITDIYGSTPSNIGKLLCEDYRCKLISGLNLPMLIRVLNNPQLSLDEMAEKATSGAHDGIILCDCFKATSL